MSACAASVRFRLPLERLQKLLAAAGYGSRRSAETLIVAGRVTVDGRPATLGQSADPTSQRIAVDGRPLPPPAAAAVWMLHKPRGYLVSAKDPHGRRTIYDLLPRDAPRGLRYVGRLDWESEGLLLLTTDGELAHRLTHPRYEVWKTYVAEIEGAASEDGLERLRRGIELDDGPAAPARVERVDNARIPRGCSLLRIAVREGKNREVRRMLAAIGHEVTRLIRIELGGVRLGDLPIGASRPLTAAEEARLRALVGRVDATEGVSL